MFRLLRPLLTISNTPIKQLKYFSTNNKLSNKIYTDTHEWILKENDYYKLGLCHKALEELNDLVYIEPLCEVGDITNKGDDLIIIESVKTTDNINAPFECEIIEINEELEEDLDLLNSNPECEDNSWFVKIKKIE